METMKATMPVIIDCTNMFLREKKKVNAIFTNPPAIRITHSISVIL